MTCSPPLGSFAAGRYGLNGAVGNQARARGGYADDPSRGRHMPSARRLLQWAPGAAVDIAGAAMPAGSVVVVAAVGNSIRYTRAASTLIVVMITILQVGVSRVLLGRPHWLFWYLLRMLRRHAWLGLRHCSVR